MINYDDNDDDDDKSGVMVMAMMNKIFSSKAEKYYFVN